MRLLILTAGIVVAGATAASAYPYGDSFERREYHQEKRIERGVRDGSITPREYYRLQSEQRRIDALEHRARRDGIVTPYERYRIRRAQDEASRHIYQERHDWQTRGDWSWRRW